MNRLLIRSDKKTAKELVAEHQKQNLPVKLHVGCGTKYFDGWINLDNNSDFNISKLEINHDMRLPLPFEEDSVDFIYNEHFLEHLTIEEGQQAIKDFMRVLKKGGVMRMAMPDLKETVDNYLNLPIDCLLYTSP